MFRLQFIVLKQITCLTVHRSDEDKAMGYRARVDRAAAEEKLDEQDAIIAEAAPCMKRPAKRTAAASSSDRSTPCMQRPGAASSSDRATLCAYMRSSKKVKAMKHVHDALHALPLDRLPAVQMIGQAAPRSDEPVASEETQTHISRPVTCVYSGDEIQTHISLAETEVDLQMCVDDDV